MGIDAQMLVRVSGPLTSLYGGVTPGRCRKLAVELVESFGTDVVSVIRPGEFSWHPNGRHALEIIEKYEQDGPDIEPEEGETLIECHLQGRYYGVDYERGPLPDFIMVATWLEAKIPAGEVWYGGDSSGVLAEPFGPVQREALWKHFLEHAHRPYHDYFKLGIAGQARPTCDFCAGQPMMDHGGGQDYSFYLCHGCDLHVRQYRDGRIVKCDRDWKPVEPAN